MTNQPNPNKDIASSIIGAAIKRKAASEIIKDTRVKRNPVKTIQALYRGNKERNKLANDKDFQNKIDLKIKSMVIKLQNIKQEEHMNQKLTNN